MSVAHVHWHGRAVRPWGAPVLMEVHAGTPVQRDDPPPAGGSCDGPGGHEHWGLWLTLHHCPGALVPGRHWNDGPSKAAGLHSLAHFSRQLTHSGMCNTRHWIAVFTYTLKAAGVILSETCTAAHRSLKADPVSRDHNFGMCALFDCAILQVDASRQSCMQAMWNHLHQIGPCARTPGKGATGGALSAGCWGPEGSVPAWAPLKRQAAAWHPETGAGDGPASSQRQELQACLHALLCPQSAQP